MHTHNAIPLHIMSSITTLLRCKLRQSGPRGVIVSALRHAANRIDCKRTSTHSDAKQANEFLAWVRFAVPGMLEQGNIEAMEYAVSNMPPGHPIVEIGSFCGLSTIVLTYLLEKHCRIVPLFTCDKWEFEGQHVGTLLGDSQSVTHDAYRAYVKGTFLQSMRTFATNRLPHTIECFSDDFFRHWQANEETVDIFGHSVTLGGKISFCYIDGNHTYEFAKRDFINADRALVSGGYVLFDDSADGTHWEVNQLTCEIATHPHYELISRNPNYLFRKK